MASQGVDLKGSTISRTLKSEPVNQFNSDKEPACLHNQSWIKPQTMQQGLSSTDSARDESCGLYRGSQMLLNSSAPGLMELFPQPTVFANSISAAAKQKSPSCKSTQETAAMISVQSQRWSFLSHGSVQTNATISRPASATAATAGKPTIAPLTIFYNGTVSVYDVPAQKAEEIMMFATTAISNGKASSSPTTTCGPSRSKFMSMAIPAENFEATSAKQQPTRKLITGMPVARKQSLQRFLEKRKERLNSTTPYTIKPTSWKTPACNEGLGSVSLASPMV